MLAEGRNSSPRSGRLLVVASERVSEWIHKGEVVDRYYNPGDRFEEVHLLLTNDDRPDPRVLQRLAGAARVAVHNLPEELSLPARKLGPWPRLLGGWAAHAVPVAREIQPDLVRCYGAHVNGLCGVAIKRALGVPLVVSVHDPRHYEDSRAVRAIRRTTLRQADLVLAVYRPLVPYLRRLGARRVEVAYNVLNGAALRVKQDYGLHDPVRVLTVGRHVLDKDPRPLIRAVAARPGVTLSIVGDGPLREHAAALVRELGVGDRVELRSAISNDQLVAELWDHDLFAAHFEHPEAPKAVLEPMLAGLPVLVNRRPEGDVPELNAEVCLLVDPGSDGFGAGIDALVADAALRERLGRAARAWAYETLDPERAEQRVVRLYEELLERRPALTA